MTRGDRVQGRGLGAARLDEERLDVERLGLDRLGRVELMEPIVTDTMYLRS